MATETTTKAVAGAGSLADSGVAETIRTRHFIAGDPLRAVAAVLVMFSHVVLLLKAGTVTPLNDRFGHLVGNVLDNFAVGLYIFFVLSGYLIAGPFVRAYVNGKPFPRVLPYLERRLLRIVPAFWVAVTLSLILIGRDASWGRVAAIYGFVQQYYPSISSLRFSQGWTLGVELGFYFLVPIIFGLVFWVARLNDRRTARIVVIAALLLAIEAFSIWLQVYLPGRHEVPGGPPCLCETQTRAVPAMLFAFVPGIALVLVELVLAQKVRATRWMHRLSVPFVLVGIAMLGVYAGLSFGHHGLRAFTQSVGSGLVVGGVLWKQWSSGGAWRVLDNRLMHWLGERSYSIYVVHFVILVEIIRVTNFDSGPGQYLWRAAVGVAACIVGAALSYSIVEKPILDWKDRRLGSSQSKSSAAAEQLN